MLPDDAIRALQRYADESIRHRPFVADTLRKLGAQDEVFNAKDFLSGFKQLDELDRANSA
jgi:hypothetical protein